MTATRRQSGVALLEAMLALAVFGIAVISLVSVLKEMSLLAVESTVQQHAVTQMQSLLAEELRMPGVRERVRTIGPDAMGVTYKVEVGADTTLVNRDGSVLPGMYRVLVTATWMEDEREETLRAETLRNVQLYQ